MAPITLFLFFVAHLSLGISYPGNGWFKNSQYTQPIASQYKSGNRIYPEDNDLLIQERQSPINIKENKAIPTDLPPIKFIDHRPAKTNVRLVNGKHTVSLKLKDLSPQPCVKGGPVKIQYCMSEAHLHWGASANEGSEHLLNGKSFPAEIHVVYEIPENLVTPKRPRYFVTGYFLEVCDDDNPLLETFTEGLKRVNPNNTETIYDANPFLRLIDMINDQPTYYTYPGSLTTSPFSEVTWTVFPVPSTISYYQLQQLRELQGEDGNNILSNFRETFPLGRRKLLKAKTGGKYRLYY